MPDGGAANFLTYCTNVHPGETVEEILRTLDLYTVPVKEQVSPNSPMGLGLWLSNDVVDEILRSPDGVKELREQLRSRGLFAFTLNAFPYGGFHQDRVKEQVFIPSWADRRRLEYTVNCAVVLAGLLEEGHRGSISTLPLGLSEAGFTSLDRNESTRNLKELMDSFSRIESETGRWISLGLEAEPGAVLGTVDAAASYLDREVFSSTSDSLRRYLGVCVDACHEAVMFQEPEESIDSLRRHGISVSKFQITSALEIGHSGDSTAMMDRLRLFDEGRYLHQVGLNTSDGDFILHGDLEPFFASKKSRVVLEGGGKGRVHFHVPVFADPEGELTTTRRELERLLRCCVEERLTDHYEVETYTFSVLPDQERDELGGTGLAALLERELRWANSFVGCF